MKSSLLLPLVLCLSLVTGFASDEKPNILLFYTDGREELYNLSDDVGETKNLIASMPEKAEA